MSRFDLKVLALEKFNQINLGIAQNMNLTLIKNVRRIILVSLWGLILLSSSTVIASGETLDKLLADAIATNPAVKVQRAQVDAAKSAFSSANWKKFPSASAGVEQNTDTYDATAVIAIEQPLWTGGKLDAGEALSESAVDEESSRLQEVVDTLIRDVVTKYYEVLQFESRLKHRSQAEEELRSLVATIKKRVDATISPRADLIQAEARFYQAMRDRLTAEERLISARAQLDRLVGRGVDKLVWHAPLEFRHDLDYFLEQALRNSSALQRLKASVEKSKNEVDLSDANFFPDVKVGVRSSSIDVFGGSQFSTPIAFISLDYDSGAGLSTRSDNQTSVARLKAAQAELEYETSKLHEESLILWRKKESLESQLQPLRDLEIASRAIFESNLKQFSIGKRSWLDVLNSVRDMTDSALSRTDAEIGLQSTLASMIVISKEPNALFSGVNALVVLR